MRGSRERLCPRTASGVLASPLDELTGFYLTVDCLDPHCRGGRKFAVAELASFYKGWNVGEVLRRMQCAGGRGGRVLAAWLETGPIPQAAAGALLGWRREELADDFTPAVARVA